MLRLRIVDNLSIPDTMNPNERTILYCTEAIVNSVYLNLIINNFSISILQNVDNYGNKL